VAKTFNSQNKGVFMSRIVALTFMIIVGLLTIGCSKDAKTASFNGEKSDVLNVAAAPAPAAEPVAAQPVYDAQPVSYAAAPTQTVGAANKSYTIKKGDTLFSIAKSQFGSGRDWQKLVSANPGLDPQKLRVGQQIVIP